MLVTDFTEPIINDRETKADFFEKIKQEKNFVGFLYELDYEGAKIILNDNEKNALKGVPLGCFLIAIYSNELRENALEGVLLRVVDVAEIPQKQEMIKSLTETYISDTSEKKLNIDMDVYTRYYHQNSGLSARALGTFYVDQNGNLVFGTDIESFLGAHNYKVYKPQKEELGIIVNENMVSDIHTPKEEIGNLRYASSQSYDEDGSYAPAIYLRTNDIVSRRTAFFGMTRTGKSNTIKIIVSAIEKLNEQQKQQIGQIIFDINGEYTFANVQDETCIFDKFKDKNKVKRFSLSARKAQEHKDVEPIQYNFYEDETLEESFELLCDEIALNKSSDYFKAFMSVDMFDREEDDDHPDAKRREEIKRHKQRKRAIYQCILYRAKFPAKQNYKVEFTRFKLADKTLKNNDDPKYHEGVSLELACKYFENVDRSKLDTKYNNDKDWDALLKVLKATNVSGFKALMGMDKLHSKEGSGDSKKKIDSALRAGEIVLLDLSTASGAVQEKYISRLCAYIFQQSMDKFTSERTPEFIQMYFEEAHNIFPKDDKDLKNIYNRLAKEGAKLNIGISYSTQEVSSIAPSILKNTQNWFISHLNNKDEVKILEKYYDFSDFSQSIIRNSDVGLLESKLILIILLLLYKLR
uniref:ATP-binding protein n=1 Tax=Helicobacter suis TaxID=104628 RepID=UPI00248FE23D